MSFEHDRLPPDWPRTPGAHPTRFRPRRAHSRVNARARSRGRHAASHFTVRASAGRWCTLAPGVDMKLLHRTPVSLSYLLRIAAGMRVLAHEHADDEECLVPEGEIWLGDTREFAGDYHLARCGSTHGELRAETGCLLFPRGPLPEPGPRQSRRA